MTALGAVQGTGRARGARAAAVWLALLLAGLLLACASARAQAPSEATLGWFGPISPESTGGSENRASGLACPSTEQCTAINNQAEAVTFDPHTAAGEKLTPTIIDAPNSPDGISCVSEDRCTAVDNEGYEITFDPQAPGSPTPVRAHEVSLSAVDCTSASSCVGVGDGWGTVSVFDPGPPFSTEPLWFDAGNGMPAVDCPAANQCTALDLLGNETTFDPQPPYTVLSSVSIATAGEPWTQTVSCPSATLCVAGETSGDEVSFDPLAPATRSVAYLGRWLWSVDCPSATQCTALDEHDAITFDPAHPGGERRTVAGVSGWVPRVVCPSSTQCTVATEDRESTFDPTTAGTAEAGGGEPEPPPPVEPEKPPAPPLKEAGTHRSAEVERTSEAITSTPAPPAGSGSSPAPSGGVGSAYRACLAPGALATVVHAARVVHVHGATLTLAAVSLSLDGTRARRAAAGAVAAGVARGSVTVVALAAGARPPARSLMLARGVTTGTHRLTAALHYRGAGRGMEITRALRTTFVVC